MQYYEERLSKVKALLKKLNDSQEFTENSTSNTVVASCCCPITGLLFVDPVIASDNHTYERSAIIQWIGNKPTPQSPMILLSIERTVQPNWAIKKIVDAIREQKKEQAKAAIAECLQYVAKLLVIKNTDYTSFLAQQLLRAVLKISPSHELALQQFKNIFDTILSKEQNALFAIFGGSFMSLSVKAPNEITLLTLFLHYLTLTLSQNNPLFSLQPVEKVGIQRLLPVFEQWLEDLAEIKTMKDIQTITDYAQRLHTRITKQTEFCIVPSGFAQLNTFELSEGRSPVDATFYKGPTASAAIVDVERNNSGYRQWTQIDPFSPYHQQAQLLLKKKRAVALNIKEVPLNNITQQWLSELITLKVIAPGPTTSYRSEHLYETLLARLAGKTEFKDNIDHTFKTARENAFCSAWYVVKDVFYHLLTQLFEPVQGQNLYKRILCGFQLGLLNSVGERYKNLPLDATDNSAQLYLLQEMCAKLAADALKINTIEKRFILETIEKVQENINTKEIAFLDQRTQDRQLPSSFQAQPTFLQSAPAILANLKNNDFIHHAITDDVTAETTLHKAFTFPLFSYGEDNGTHSDAYTKLEQLANSFDAFLNDPQLTYSLNESYYIALTIEHAILSLLDHGLSHWFAHNNPQLLPQAASWLLKMGQLYYSAACRVAYENQCRDSDYNPMHYGKLLVMMHAIYAMMDVLVRKDPFLGAALKDYQISLQLNDQLSFSLLWKELILPDKNWVRVLGELKHYFDEQSTLTKKLLFDYNRSTYYFFQFALDADKQNNNIQCALTLLDSAMQKKLHSDFSEISIEKMAEKWAALWCGDYLPLLFRCLRDSANYAHISLRGITAEQINIVKKQINSTVSIEQTRKKYTSPGVKQWSVSSGYAWGCHSFHENTETISIPSVNHDNRPTQYAFNEKQKKFQHLTYPRFLVKNTRVQTISESVTNLENHYLANHSHRPESLAQSQYITLSFIRTNLHIKLSRLYIALKNKTLSLDIEEHAILIKQTLFEVSEMTLDEKSKQFISFLERRFRNERFADIFVSLFVDLSELAKRKLHQHRLLKDVFDILILLYSYSANAIKNKIQVYFNHLRGSLTEEITKGASPQSISIYHAFIILSYKTQNELTKNDIQLILKSRSVIEQNSRLGASLPTEIYAKIMHFLFARKIELTQRLNADKNLLGTVLTNAASVSVPQSWQPPTDQTSLYRCGVHAIDPIRGRLYENNVPIGGLSHHIIENRDYIAAFGKMPLLVTTDYYSGNQKKLIRYTSKNPHHEYGLSLFRRITLLDSKASQVWIEESENNNAFQTFIPHRHLRDLLPKVLVEDYTHWCGDNRMYIKNKQRESEFVMDLNDGAMTTLKHSNQRIPHNHRVIPFHAKLSQATVNNHLFKKILTRFENIQYILLLSNDQGAVNQIASASMIYFPRFQLTFSIQGENIISHDYKGYRLSPNQQVNTLLGVSHYLVIESLTNATQRKLIMGYRREAANEAAFYKTNFRANRKDEPHQPIYFTYSMDENLNTLHAETTAGKLYLAWLFYKTASLTRDPLTQLNGYEMASEILKTCWQNVTYDTQELEIIVRFLDLNYDQLQTWKKMGKVIPTAFSTDSDDIEEQLEDCFVLRKEQHRNAIAIMLRVLFLMSESLETHFLHKKESTIKLNEASDIERRHYLKAYGKSYFLYYLNVKNRIHEKCLLSPEEEQKFLEAYRELYTDDLKAALKSAKTSSEKEKLLVYYSIFKDKKDLSNSIDNYLTVLEKPAESRIIAGQKARNYKNLLLGFTEKNALKSISLAESAKNFFQEKYKSSTSYAIESLPELEHYGHWVNFSNTFDFKQFIAFYQLILSKTVSQETLESILNVVALRKKQWWESKDNEGQTRRSQRAYHQEANFHQEEDERTKLSEFYLSCLRMLYVVIYKPELFPTPPAFLFSDPGQLRFDNEAFYFSDEHLKITQANFFSFTGSSTDAQSVRVDLWEIFEQHFLTKNLVKLSIVDLEKADFAEKLQNTLYTEFLAKNKPAALVTIAKNLTQEFSKKLAAHCLQIAKNKALFNFFVTVAKTCDILINNSAIALGKIMTSIARIEHPVVVQFTPQFAVPNAFPPLPPIESSSSSIINANTYRDIVEIRPSDDASENRAFPLAITAPRGTVAFFSKQFGKYFIEQFKTSYNMHLSTPVKRYRLLKPMTTLETELLQALIQHRQQQNTVWQSIQLDCFKKPTTPQEVIFVLSQYVGQRSFYTKKDLLKMIAANALSFSNPQAHQVLQKLHRYVLGEVQRMHWERVLTLIAQYKTLTDGDEQEFLVQEIAKNLHYQQEYSAAKYPAWLLFELENNLTIRENQRSLTEVMIHNVQAKELNAALKGALYQLNMGEGKTSVILLLLALELANSQRLVRINVLDPLMGVTRELLSIKLGGLLQKRVYQMPFSRDVDISVDNLQKIYRTLIECKNNKHILLTTPGHRLCLHLKYQEKLLEYVQFKDADNKFRWDRYTQACEESAKFYSLSRYSSFSSNSSSSSQESHYYSQEEMKVILVKAGYIDEEDRILMNPDDPNEKGLFFDVFYQTAKALYPSFKYGQYQAGQILKTQITSLRDEIREQLILLTQIEKIAFCDILDESDEILRHGTELNYTLGEPIPLDAGSLRWKIPSMLLSILFFERGSVIEEQLENSSNEGKVVLSPYLRISRMDFLDDIKDSLLMQLASKIFKEFDIKTEAFLYYTPFILNPLEKGYYEMLIKDSNVRLKPIVLLVKAWLSHNLLYHVMSQRYRVEYGLDAAQGQLPQNEMAIPYKGMDDPSPRSEFSHPDVGIGFTILSYYYQGLHTKQLIHALRTLKEHERNDEQLQRWFNVGVNYPDWMRSFDTIDLENEEHILQITHFLAKNVHAIHYYLDMILFPAKVKYYPKKITGNAHTLAGSSNTIGFSGTDDRKDTLPATVQTEALGVQKATNGKMAHLMTRPSNKSYRAIDTISVEAFLDAVAQYTHEHNGCYALIDAGAMTTGMNTQQVASYLLKKIHNRFKGVVYFDDRTGQVFVLMLQGRKPLATCHLDKTELFVYLDDIHTRGSDLKLPLRAQGIVTLSYGMNKDKLMQAMMRLRQLEWKQSVCFWGAKNVTVSIKGITGKENITSLEVLIWVTFNTVVKISSVMYPVAFEQLKYIIKQRALAYQSEKENLDYPITALINYCLESADDKLEESYEKTPEPIGSVYNFLGINKNNLQLKFKNAVESELTRRSLCILFEQDTLAKVPANFIGIIIWERRSNFELYSFNKNNAPKEKQWIVLSHYRNIFQGRCKELCKKNELYISREDFNDFIDYTNEALETELPLIPFKYNEEQRVLDYEADDQTMGSVLANVKNKLPEAIVRIPSELDANQEKEKEIEREQALEVVLPEDLNAQTEKSWNFERIFEADFVAKGIDLNTNKTQYPQLLALHKYFEHADSLREEAKNIQWHSNILATDAFIQTVHLQGQKNQEDYLRPADAILIHKKSGTNYFILLSGSEANEIHILFNAKPQCFENTLFLMHLNDENFDMAIPTSDRNSLFRSSEEQQEYAYIRVILKLFNGECNFNPQEESLLNQALGIVTSTALISEGIDHAKSMTIYGELISRKYLQQQGFFAKTLIEAVNSADLALNKAKVSEKEQSLTRQRLMTVQNKSIIKPGEQTALVTLPLFFNKVVTVRGKSKHLPDSLLGKKIGATR